MIGRHVGSWGGFAPDVVQMRRDMERLMDRFAAPSATAAGVFPPLNVSEDADHYYVRAPIPGVDPTQLSVSVVNQTVTLSGEQQPANEPGVSYHRKERAEGPFRRSVTLPASFDGAHVQARYVDGILTLTLPKSEAAKPRRVAVQSS